MLGFLVQRQVCSAEMEMAFLVKGGKAGLLKNYTTGNKNNKKRQTVFYHCWWEKTDFQTQHFKGKTPLCLYVLPKAYDTTAYGHTYTECSNFCVNAGKEEKSGRVCQHKLLLATSKSWQREPFGECKVAYKSRMLEKSNNQEVWNLKEFSELVIIY